MLQRGRRIALRMGVRAALRLRCLSIALLVVGLLAGAVVPVGAQATRPVVVGTFGMVASNHPLASMSGMQILLQGGNAVDAAIATAAALGVVEPYLSGAGGDGFMMIYWAATDEIYFLNFTGRAPKALTAAHFGDRIPTRGPLVVLVPGAVAGWETAIKRFGSMTLHQVLQPAIQLAENGYPLTQFGEENHRSAQALFLDWDEAGAQAWWGGNWQPPKLGDIIKNHKLARTYRILAEKGAEAFYRGELAEEIVRFVQKHGGVLTLEDMASYQPRWEEPLHTNYRGIDIYTPRPNSSGGLAVSQILNIVEGFDLKSMGVNSADYIHVMVEAIKLAAADRAEWSGDPDFMDVEIPFDLLLSKDYAAERRALIDMNRAMTNVPPGVSQPGTSHVSVVDQFGNMVSMTVTLGSNWGSGVVAGETGVILNNGILWFELDPESPAYVEGGKRTRWNMSPVIASKDGKPFLVLGTPGGDGIWQTLPQVITKLVDFGMDIQSAIESPRFRWTIGTLTVRPESRIPQEVLDELAARGHDVQPYPEWTSNVGGVNGIIVDPETGAMMGGADPRRDGYVIGW